MTETETSRQRGKMKRKKDIGETERKGEQRHRVKKSMNIDTKQ